MLNTETMVNIHNIIQKNDAETVGLMREEAIKELSRLKKVEASNGINAYERNDIAINVEIITLAEAKLNGDERPRLANNRNCGQ